MKSPKINEIYRYGIDQFNFMIKLLELLRMILGIINLHDFVKSGRPDSIYAVILWAYHGFCRYSFTDKL